MKKKLILLFASFLIFATFATKVFATSSYVLPYPGTMPGNLLYKPHLFLEKILSYWYFGSLGQFTFNLKESDKYLVEAKTLFEYNQYLLGYNALLKSDDYFMKTLPNLNNAKSEGKNVSQYRLLLSSAAEKHIEVLQVLEKEVPDIFNWQPEKSASSVLNLKSAIEQSIKIRQNFL